MLLRHLKRELKALFDNPTEGVRTFRLQSGAEALAGGRTNKEVVPTKILEGIACEMEKGPVRKNRPFARKGSN